MCYYKVLKKSNKKILYLTKFNPRQRKVSYTVAVRFSEKALFGESTLFGKLTVFYQDIESPKVAIFKERNPSLCLLPCSKPTKTARSPLHSQDIVHLYLIYRLSQSKKRVSILSFN